MEYISQAFPNASILPPSVESSRYTIGIRVGGAGGVQMLVSASYDFLTELTPAEIKSRLEGWTVAEKAREAGAAYRVHVTRDEVRLADRDRS